MNSRLNPNELRHVVLTAIVSTAPDIAAEISTIGDDVDLFDEFGLDSMDRMNIMTAVVESTGIQIPDELYPRLNTINELIGHLS